MREYLEHYGVKGMKWGRRRKRNMASSKEVEVKRRSYLDENIFQPGYPTVDSRVKRYIEDDSKREYQFEKNIGKRNSYSLQGNKKDYYRSKGKKFIDKVKNIFL